MDAVSPVRTPSGVVAIARAAVVRSASRCSRQRRPGRRRRSTCRIPATSARSSARPTPRGAQRRRRRRRVRRSVRAGRRCARRWAAPSGCRWSASPTPRERCERACAPGCRIVAPMPHGGMPTRRPRSRRGRRCLVARRRRRAACRRRSLAAADARVRCRCGRRCESLNVAVAGALWRSTRPRAQRRGAGNERRPVRRRRRGAGEPARRRRRSPSACARARSTRSSARRQLLGAGPAAARGDRARRAAVDHPLGTAGHRQDDARAGHRRRAPRAEFVAVQRRARRHQGDQGGDGRRRARGAAAAAGPSSSSTRSIASTRRSRTRSCRASRPATSSSSARRPRTRRSRSTRRCSRARRSSSCSRSTEAAIVDGSSSAPLTDGERGLGRARRRTSTDEALRRDRARYANGDARSALNLLELAVAAAPAAGRHVRASTSALLRTTLQRKRAALRQGRRGALQPHLGAAQVDAQQRSRRRASTGWRACSRPARIRCTSRGGWCASRPRTSATPIRRRWSWPMAAQRRGPLPRHARGRHRAGAGGDLPGDRAQEQRRLRGLRRRGRGGQQDVAEPVPLHLRNAPTRLMKQLDYGKGYQLRPRRRRRRRRHGLPAGAPRRAAVLPPDRTRIRERRSSGGWSGWKERIKAHDGDDELRAARRPDRQIRSKFFSTSRRVIRSITGRPCGHTVE